jgi:hypothetical protein
MRRTTFAFVALLTTLTSASANSPSSCALITSKLRIENAPVARSGWVDASDIFYAGTEILATSDFQIDAMYAITNGQDVTGSVMEMLLAMTASQTNCNSAMGPKYEGDKGIDLTVDDRALGRSVVVYEAKQWTSGWFSDGFQLSSTSVGYQLSDTWIQNTVDKSADYDSRELVRSALRRLNQLVKAGAVVQRDCGWWSCEGHFYIFPFVVNYEALMRFACHAYGRCGILLGAAIVTTTLEAAVPTNLQQCEQRLQEVFDRSQQKRISLDPQARKQLHGFMHDVREACKKSDFTAADRSLTEMATFVAGYVPLSKEEVFKRFQEHQKKQKAVEQKERGRRGQGPSISLGQIRSGNFIPANKSECERAFQSLIDEGRKRSVSPALERELSPMMASAEKECEAGNLKAAAAAMTKVAEALSARETRKLHPQVEEAIRRGEQRQAAEKGKGSPAKQ